MLGKLIKHEFKAIGRLYIPIFAVVLVMTPIFATLFQFSSNIGEQSISRGLLVGMGVTGYVIMMIGLCISSFLFVILRFYKTVATSEAYLTFCLPVKPTQILFSKLFVGVIWEVLSAGLALLSLYIMFLIQGASIPPEIVRMYEVLKPLIVTEYGSVAMFLICLVLIALVSAIAGTMTFFLSVCLGQLFNEHRGIISVGMYSGLYFVMQIISVGVFLPFLIKGPSSIMVGEVATFQATADSIPTVGFFATLGIMQLVFAVIMYIVSSFILKKKTNVR